MSLETGQLVGAGAVISVALIGGYWALAKFIVTQFKEDLKTRFIEQEKARKEVRQEAESRLLRVEENHRDLETDFLRHQAKLPVDYVRKEDFVRSETVVNAKLDALASKMDLFNERSGRKEA